jgi:ATP-dependent DNA helicase RecQ
LKDIHHILKTYWGYESFRPLQAAIINSVISGKDTLALLPTGGGKSLCFQVPALAMEGLCIVISPLVALMKDQVENLRKRNITALAIHAGMNRKEVMTTLRVAGNSNCRFLYVSPERLETALFKEYLPGLPVCLIAVDEAHCISQWGYDFRPSYLRIQAFREDLPGVPILALTASATPAVQKDICKQLLCSEYDVFRQSFERTNLSYSAFEVASKINKVVDILTKVQGSSIVYCKSRKRTKEYADLLNMHGIVAGYYHAGLEREQRDQIQDQWLSNKIRTIVCTNAFGMGIDKPDVRLVIHPDTPDCLENYYQEAGRAGRDGKKAYAVLLYNQKELKELSQLTDIRYPSVEDVRVTYQALINYLQLPSGSGEGQSYDFDFTDFIRKFKLAPALATHSLKILEQEGILGITEQVFQAATIQVVATPDTIRSIEQMFPMLDSFIKCLLRTYAGIYDQPVGISEKNISFLLKKEQVETLEALKKLNALGVIAYTPQKDKPQVYFLQSRMKAEHLQIDEKKQAERKEIFAKRIEAITQYANERSICRSIQIGNYFGDLQLKSCGKCDICLQQKNNATIQSKEFMEIHSEILSQIRPGPVTPQDLLQKLGNIKKEKAWKVLQYLEAENKIVVNKEGSITLKDN